MTVIIVKQHLDRFYSRPNTGLKIADTSRRQELALAAELAQAIGGQTEIPCALGRIDILSSQWLIEVKYTSTHGCKAALGQLLLYQYCVNWRKNLGLALIGKPPAETIRKFCKEHAITIFYYTGARWVLL